MVAASHDLFDVPVSIREFDFQTSKRLFLDSRLLDPRSYASKDFAPIAYPHPAELRGLAFKLFDPRGLYEGDNDVSFVFATSHGDPQLGGVLVDPWDGETCARSSHRARLAEAEWFLAMPGIRLRYFAEEWLEILLCLVKFFYVPDLWWTRHDDMSGWSLMQPLLEDAAGRPLFEQACFEKLTVMFGEMVRDWSATGSTARAFWDSLRRGDAGSGTP